MGTRRGSAQPRRQGWGRQGRAGPDLETLGTPDLAGRGHEARRPGPKLSQLLLNVPEGSGFWGATWGQGDFHSHLLPARQQGGGVGQ